MDGSFLAKQRNRIKKRLLTDTYRELRSDMDRISTNSLLAGAITFCQTILFVVLHDSSIRLAIAFGEPSRVRDGVAWGITAQSSVFLFAAVCLVSGFLILSVPNTAKTLVIGKVFILLTGFAVFAFLLVSGSHPKRSFLLASSALVAMVVPQLSFHFIEKFREKRRRRWVCS